MPYDETKIPEYEKIWAEMLKKTFDTFIEENIGLRPGLPECHGSGNNHSYCSACPFLDTCTE